MFLIRLAHLAAAVTAAICLLALAGALLASGPAAGEAACDVPGAYATIQSAVDDPTCDVVNVAAGTFFENVVIGRDVAVQGQVLDSTVVDGGDIDTVFTIEPSLAVTLTHLTVTGGRPPLGDEPYGGGIYNGVDSTLLVSATAVISNAAYYSNAGEGGGIYNEGRLVVADSLLSGNSAFRGGGIMNTGLVTITNSTISHNVGEFGGGGIFGGQVTVFDSLISDNAAVYWGGGIMASSLTLNTSLLNDNAAGWGGGIYGGDVTIANSTVSGNEAGGTGATGGGGGIQIVSGTLTVVNSTMSGNSTASSGGAIFITGTLTVTNSTISGNQAVSQGGGIYNAGMLGLYNSTVTLNEATNGGGVYIQVDGAAALANSILANSVEGQECDGALPVSQGYNLASDGTCNLTAAGDQPNTDPLLGPLQDNGGPTWTHALLEGSPAIDAGNPAAPGSGGNACEPADQRGISRPRDGDEDGVAVCDIGAFEVWVPTSFLYLPAVRLDPGSPWPPETL